MTSFVCVLVQRTSAWHPDDDENIWELSGLYEGDMMIYRESDMEKNGLLDASTRWPGGIVPYHIADSFCEHTHTTLFLTKGFFYYYLLFVIPANEEVAVLLGAMEEYQNLTCIRFRPYQR